MMYVIGRLAPEHPSGCVYWNGYVLPREVSGPVETVTRETLWFATSREEAEATALWLNTSPIAVGVQRQGLWQAMPLSVECGRVA